MSRFKLWMSPMLALAVAGFGGYVNRAVAQDNSSNQSEKKQADQPKESNSGGQSNQSGQTDSQKSQSQSGGSQAGSSNTGSNQPANNQSNQSNQSSQSSNKSAGQDAKSGQPGQSQSNDRADNRTGQGNANTQGQAGANTRTNQQGQAGNQPNNRDKQADNRQNQSRDNNNNTRDNNNRQTNIAVGVQFGAVNDRGLVVNTVENNSFFFRSGLRSGDVIISVNSRPIRNQAEFIEFITVSRGQRIPVIVFRDGRQETIYVTYEENLVPPQQPGMGGDAAALLGVTFDSQIPNAAVVREVLPGGAAASAGLKPGDEIIRINGQRVSSLQNTIEIVGSMKAGDQVEIDYLQLKHAQVTLAAAGGLRTAEVGVNQGVQQANYQGNVQVQGTQSQNQNRQTPGTQPGGRSSNQDSGNRGGILPRIR